ncbi:radical SAM superfamily protein [bacterium BMS3Bbin06]|nr:radical SAM superfamily protein [bacterium BMS3Bbin06]
MSFNLSRFRKPTRYINREVNVIRKGGPGVRVALAFPDVYDIGMSHLGLGILYSIINSLPHASAERVFAPWPDYRKYMKEAGVPLASLEGETPLKDFDVLGFSFQYELSYPTVLEMLALGDIPLLSDDRGEGDPVVIAGGPCTVNPVPMIPYIDAFLLGDGEEAVVEMLSLFHGFRREGGGKGEFLAALSEMEGFYVPGHSPSVKRRYVSDLENAPFPVSPVVPYVQIVHDRINIEISRGCTRGCRFCQAGMLYRPLRERSPGRIFSLVEESIARTGYDEVSFTSLSAGDYSELMPLLKAMNRRFGERNIAVSLPSLRVGAVNRELLREVSGVKKSGFTIAPEAATDRLRAVINKDFDEDEYERALHALFSEGWLNLKLYYMIGLPTEEDGDIEAIPGMVMKALKTAKRHTGRHVNITVGISTFVPKPHTPFQWTGQEPMERISEKIKFLKGKLFRKGLNVKFHAPRLSRLEAILSRGGEETQALLREVHKNGAYLDGWSEHFDINKWEHALDAAGCPEEELAVRGYERGDPLPWDFVDIGIGKEYLEKEYTRAIEGRWTGDCNRRSCNACGLGCRSGEFLSPSSLRIVPSYNGESRRFKPVRVRVEYSKRRHLRYLSHLELTGAMLRGLRRAGVDLAYSGGFSPSPRASFGPPLSVGVEGLREYLDIEVYPPFDVASYRDAINAVLPEGLEIVDMAFVFRKLPSLTSFITLYEYEIGFYGERDVRLSSLMNKKEKISEFLEKFDIIEDRRVRLRLKDLPERKVKLKEVLEGIFGMPAEDMEIARTGLFGWRKGWITPMDLVRVASRPE